MTSEQNISYRNARVLINDEYINVEYAVTKDDDGYSIKYAKSEGLGEKYPEIREWIFDRLEREFLTLNEDETVVSSDHRGLSYYDNNINKLIVEVFTRDAEKNLFNLLGIKEDPVFVKREYHAVYVFCENDVDYYEAVCYSKNDGDLFYSHCFVVDINSLDDVYCKIKEEVMLFGTALNMRYIHKEIKK